MKPTYFSGTLAALALCLSVSSASAKDFRIECKGENNNTKDSVVEMVARMNVTKETMTTPEGVFRKSSIAIESISIKSNPLATSNPGIVSFSGSKLSGVGGYKDEPSDENEDGVNDSTLRFFSYDVVSGNDKLSISFSNQGQGAGSSHVVFVTLNSQSPSPWSYCIVK